MSDLAASLVAGLILLVGWAFFAVPIGLVAHFRLRRLEGELGAPALPPRELPLLLMAVASIAWPVAVVVALVGWLKKGWARLGRNATLIFLVQITGSVLSAIGATMWNAVNPPASTADELFPLVVLASANVAAGILLATPFLWIWAGRRAARLCLAPPGGASPGLWRFALYAASLLCWPVGIVLAVMFTAPENARVGANTFRCSLLQLVGIALAVCVAVPFVARAFV